MKNLCISIRFQDVHGIGTPISGSAVNEKFFLFGELDYTTL
jgi:hypothetical protein